MPRSERLGALGRCELLSTFTADQLELMFAGTHLVTVPSGARIVQEREPGHDVFFVLAGEVRLWHHDLALVTLGPGGHFGELSMLTGRPHSATAIASAPSTLAVLRRANWEALSEQRPDFAVVFLKNVVSHLREELIERTDTLSQLQRGRSQPRERQVLVHVGAETLKVPTGTAMGALLPKEQEGALVVAGLLGQRPVSLLTPLVADCTIRPLTAAEWEGRLIYTRSAGLLILEAAHTVDPTLQLSVGASRGQTQVIEAPQGVDRAALAARIEAELVRLADRDRPFRHELWATDEAMAWFQQRGWTSAARLLSSRREGTVALVSCGKVYALSMGPMLPTTGLVRSVRLSAHEQGLFIDYGPHEPRTGAGAAPRASEGDMVADHRAWLGRMGVTSVGAFNDACVSGQVSQLIRVAEGFHEKRLSRIADTIAAARDRLRIVAIAGPSCSGKTTFTKRLTVQLQVAGLNPVGLSLDDYYLDREKTPRDAKGGLDFESVDALDLALLHLHLTRLLGGEPVKTAHYDFKTGRSHPEGGPLVHLRKGDVLMFEGIHGLNPRLLGAAVQPGELFRVFIHPATTLPLDRLTRVSATDLRLLRRIVRDRHHRGYSAADNIARWPSVQEGEQRHIFPFLGEADVIFDAALVYEPSVLKVFAERYLLEVPPDHSSYGTAWRLRTLIDRFVTIYPDHVPPTSLLREFIGGSGFEY